MSTLMKHAQPVAEVSYFDLDTVKRLISLCDEPSVKMPAGMTREERRAWAKQSQKTLEKLA